MQPLQLFSLLGALGLAAAKASTTFPTATGDETLSAPMEVSGTFDCGLKRYGRGLSCADGESGEDAAVFILADGATLQNCIIGADQSEGVHCDGSCTISNVWWEAVCEDALTLLQSGGTSTITGGGARGAEDKVIQHNGLGTVVITDFYVDDFGKLYRSCGNCKANAGPRMVVIDGVVAEGGKVLAGVNGNYGDVATISNTCGVDPDGMCQVYEACDKAQGDCEAEKLSTGFDGATCVDGGSNSESC
ncbi:pectate lyase [Geopyxis carbonaria]|nr:pectate lyase [Geopyxis carbonaria]